MNSRVCHTTTSDAALFQKFQKLLHLRAEMHAAAFHGTKRFPAEVAMGFAFLHIPMFL